MCMSFNHKFGEPNFEQLSQACLKCGKVIRIAPKPCEHVWKTIKEETYEEYNSNSVNENGLLYVLQCEKCGEIQERKIETDWS